MNAVSLFSSAGIGDLAIRKSGIKVLIANEIVQSRVNLFRRNFPETEMIQGDIWQVKNTIITEAKKRLNDTQLDILFATPPCQGMSKNGQGKLLKGIRDGKKPKLDIRNRLIIPTIDIAKELQPETIIMENVPEMENTIIEDRDGELIPIIEFIRKELGKEYVGKAEVVHFADYGVPQRRSRLITIFSKNSLLKRYFHKYNTFLPEHTHEAKPANGKLPWVTVRDVIAKLPKLDAINKDSATSSIEFHRVSVLDPKKYEWIRNTPPEKGAFDNQCINPNCKYSNNPIHGSVKDESGINRSSKETPLYCVKCNSLLPRPYTIDRTTGVKRIMSGYTSAYKRMRWDLPSPTLTTNLTYPSSDHKIHPDQNRVLSLYEAFLLHTLDQFEYFWEYENKQTVPDTVITDVIGESIPPLGLYVIVKHITGIMKGDTATRITEQQLNLLY